MRLLNFYQLSMLRDLKALSKSFYDNISHHLRLAKLKKVEITTLIKPSQQSSTESCNSPTF